MKLKEGAEEEEAQSPSAEGRIPGGKLLGQYVAKIVVANQRREWEPFKARLAGQAKRLDRTGDLEYHRMCNNCHTVWLAHHLKHCGPVSLHGAFCPDCALRSEFEDPSCPKCAIPCAHADGCATRVNPHGTVCSTCYKRVCDEHREWCRHCGTPLCARTPRQKLEGGPNCRALHECEHAPLKRAKKELK